MFSSPQNQFLFAAKSLFEMQLDVANKLGMKNLEGFTNLVNLNVHVMQMSLNDSMEKMHALLSSKDSLEFFSLVAAQAQPNASKLMSYGNDVVEITAGMRDELFKATQVEVAETSKEMTSIIEQLVEHETGSFNNMIQLTKATVKETEAAQKQVVDAAAETVKKAPRQMAHAAEKAVKASKGNHKADHQHVSQSKKTASASHKKTNGHGHRKTTH
ncbi:MAG: phasin family protein [Burkholderiaceae bacterium]